MAMTIDLKCPDVEGNEKRQLVVAPETLGAFAMTLLELLFGTSVVVGCDFKFTIWNTFGLSYEVADRKFWNR
jgi:hypothetical protein